MWCCTLKHGSYGYALLLCKSKSPIVTHSKNEKCQIKLVISFYTKGEISLELVYSYSNS